MRRHYGKDSPFEFECHGRQLGRQDWRALFVSVSSGRPVILAAPTDEALQEVSHKIIARPMERLRWRGALVERQGSTRMADNDADSDDGRKRRTFRLCHLIRPTTSSIRHERPLACDEFCGVNYWFGSLWKASDPYA